MLLCITPLWYSVQCDIFVPFLLLNILIEEHHTVDNEREQRLMLQSVLREKVTSCLFHNVMILTNTDYVLSYMYSYSCIIATHAPVLY